MGTLTPGATYIYERDGKNIYAREEGKLERRLIGYDYDGTGENIRSGLDKLQEDKLWGEIRRAAKTNAALQDALNVAIELYRLTKHP